MRVIIAGSRDIDAYQVVARAMETAALFGIAPTVVLSGTARGADRLGEQWAAKHGIAIERYSADWLRYPKTAGMIRNGHMARRADALVALWDGQSRGTAHMIKLMVGKPTWIERP